MKYRVVFRERANSGGSSESPLSFLHGEVSGGIVRGSTFVVRKAPEWKSSADSLEDDEEYSRLGTEIWEFEVAEGKDQEFKDALLNSGSILEFAPIANERD